MRQSGHPAYSTGMMSHHTAMPKTKVALMLDAELVERIDELVARRRFRNRSQAIVAALADKLQRLARTRLARESAKLDAREEKRLADEGWADDFASWPEYSMRPRNRTLVAARSTKPSSLTSSTNVIK